MRHSLFSALLAALTLASASCRSGQQDFIPQGTAPLSRQFGVAMWEPETLDQSLAAEEAGVTLARGLFEGLLNRPPGNGPMVPGVAVSHEISADGLTWTFHLRPDARWIDGRPVTSKDFAYGWRRVLNPETGSRNSHLLFFIEGAEDFHRGRRGAEGLGLTTPDSATLDWA